MSLEELQNIMTEYGIALRAVPKKVRQVFEPCHSSLYPEGRLEYLDGYGRVMLVVESVPEHAGEILVEQVRSTASTVIFSNRYYRNIEEAVAFIVEGRQPETIYTERKGAGTCGTQ